MARTSLAPSRSSCSSHHSWSTFAVRDGEFHSNFNDAWNQAERYVTFARDERDYLLRQKNLRFENDVKPGGPDFAVARRGAVAVVALLIGCGGAGLPPARTQLHAAVCDVGCLADRCERDDLAACGPAAVKLSRSAEPQDRVRAVRLDEIGCAKDDAKRCLHLAHELDSGNYIAKDEDRERAIYQRLCDRGTGEACWQLTYFAGVQADVAKELYARACDHGFLEGCLRQAQGAPLEARTLEQRVFDAELAHCKSGDAHACLRAGRVGEPLQATVPLDAWAAVRTAAKRGCEAKIAEDCFNVAWMAEEGVTGPPDPAAALEFRRRACDAGDGATCTLVAIALGDADPATPKLLERACALGDDYGCNLAAPASGPKALAMHLRACELGNDSSCDVVESFYEGALDLPADPVGTRAIRVKLCQRGRSDRCLMLGDAASQDHDLATARTFYARSCKLHDVKRGCASLARLLHDACARGDCTELDQFLATLPPSKRDLAALACCRDRPGVGGSPTALFMRFRTAITDKDITTLRSLIDPKTGLSVRQGWHGEDGSRETIWTVTPSTIQLDKLDTVGDIDPNHLECPDQLDLSGAATCRAFEGGYVGTFRFETIGGHIYLVDVNEEGH
jgi:TPR repeat protein